MASNRVTPEVIQKEQEVLQLRRSGLTFDQIAERTGYSHASSAHAAYTRACKRIIQSDIEELRIVEMDRLDIALAAVWKNVLQGDIHAINAFLRISERRSRLLGMDAPTRVESKQEVSWADGNEIDREVQRLAELLDNSGTIPVGESVGEN